MAYSVTYIVLSVLGLIGVVAAGVFFLRNGVMKAAKETIDILKDQVEALRTRMTELEKLEVTVDILKGLVTQAAPVKELAERQEARHEENILFLTRLEGSLSRVESRIMRGER